MENNFEQLKTLKELLESGAISKTEYDSMKEELLRKSMANDGVKSAMEPSAIKKLIKKYKWYLIALPIIAIVAYLFWDFQKGDPTIKAEELAKQYCDCESQNNKEYINRLSDFIETFDSKKYEFSSDADKELTQMFNEYNARTLNVSISTCNKALELKIKEMREKYKNETSQGKDFWFAYQSKITKNFDLAVQLEDIKNLNEAANKKKASLVYNKPSDLRRRKNDIANLMTSFYSSLSSEYFDAYDYFAYKVEKYFGKKNISPTDINMLFNAESDYEDSKFKFVSETLQLVSADEESEIWEYSTEFQTYRTSKEKYQICNVWYEVKFNVADKI